MRNAAAFTLGMVLTLTALVFVNGIAAGLTDPHVWPSKVSGGVE